MQKDISLDFSVVALAQINYNWKEKTILKLGFEISILES